MDIRSLRPARDFAINYGVKAVVYGPAGSGKTPISNTAPRPLLLACEPGLLSMRTSTMPTWIGSTGKTIDEFFQWFFGSNEVKGFDTLIIDSTSQMAETYVAEAEKTNKHGLAAYGEANRNTLAHMERLYFMPQKHAYLIAKQELAVVDGMSVKRPWYPGRELPIKFPHRFDQILQLDIHSVPNQGQVKAFCCQSTMGLIARDRTGNLAQYEPPDFAAIVRKAMQ